MGAEPALLTELEAAERLRVCPRTLRKERQAGRLAYILIGRCVKYHPADLESFIERARICQSLADPAPRSTGSHSASRVVDFAAALDARRSGMPKK